MHTPLAQHEWLAAVLRGHYGYYGRPHNYPALNGFYRQVRRTWLCCLRRRSQTNRRMGWEEFEHPDRTLSTANASNPSTLGTGSDMKRVTLGKSRVREVRPPGSVMAKAKLLSYSTTTLLPVRAVALFADDSNAVIDVHQKFQMTEFWKPQSAPELVGGPNRAGGWPSPTRPAFTVNAPTRLTAVECASVGFRSHHCYGRGGALPTHPPLRHDARNQSRCKRNISDNLSKFLRLLTKRT